jgi:hypothetical protein
MKLSDLNRAIEILKPHYNDPDGYHIGAEHDQIYLYATNTPLNEDERKEMEALGWRQENVEEGEYDPSESWMHFT